MPSSITTLPPALATEAPWRRGCTMKQGPGNTAFQRGAHTGGWRILTDAPPARHLTPSWEPSSSGPCTARPPRQRSTVRLGKGVGAGGEGTEFGCGAAGQQQPGDEGPHRRAGVRFLWCQVFGGHERAGTRPAVRVELGPPPRRRSSVRPTFQAGQTLRGQYAGCGQGGGGVTGGELGGYVVELNSGRAEAAAVIAQCGAAAEAIGDGGGPVRQLLHPRPVAAPRGTVRSGLDQQAAFGGPAPGCPEAGGVGGVERDLQRLFLPAGASGEYGQVPRGLCHRAGTLGGFGRLASAVGCQGGERAGGVLIFFFTEGFPPG